MKSLKIYYLLFFLAVVIQATCMTGCTSKIDQGDLGTFPYMDVDQTSVTIGKEANDNIEIKVKTNRPYSVGISDPWLSMKSNSGDRLILAAKENTEETKRTTEVKLSISGGTITKSLTVTQDESGVVSYRGDAFLGSDQAIAELVNAYNRIYGNMIIGNNSGNSTDYDAAVLIGETEHYFKYTTISQSSLPALVSGISEVTGDIYVIANDIYDLSPLAKYSGVKGMTLIGNSQVSSISFIESMNLESLVVRETPEIVDLGVVSNHATLQNLDIASNNLDSADFLSEAYNLRTLVLGKGVGETNDIYDLTCLYGLNELAYLDISGLPVSPAEIESLISALPNCEIICNDMRAGAPILSEVTFSDVSSTSMTLNAVIEDPGVEAPFRIGFRFGTDLSDSNQYTEYLTEIGPDNAISYTISGLNPSTLYQASAFAENLVGTGMSNVSVSYTEGPPEVGDVTVNAYDNYSINVKSVLKFAGTKGLGSGTKYGTIIGIVQDLDTSSYLYINTHAYESDTYEEINWSDDYQKLNSGTRYYVRSYAYNKYGISYSDIYEIVTGGTPNQNRFNLKVIPYIPVYTGTSSGNTAPAEMYGTFFRNDITGSGEWIMSSLQDNMYSYTLYEGTQNLVFVNSDGNTGNLSCTANASGTELVKYTVSGENGAGTQLLAGILRDKNITTAETVEVNMQRLTSKMSLYLSYQDSDGSVVTDLSSKISSMKVTVNGLSSEVVLSDNFVWSYGGSSQLYGDVSSISTTSTQTVFQGIHVLPSGKPVSFTVVITFVDNSTVTLNTAYKTIAANTDNNITLRLSQFENALDGSFTIEAIEEIDEEIEF